MRKLKKHEYVLLGIFAFIAGYPLATATDGWSFEVVPLASMFSPREVMDMSTEQSALRRSHNEVRRLCIQRMGEDDTAECPDINNAVQVERFMLGLPLHEAADANPNAEESELRLSDLGQVETSMLRRFKRLGSCPHGLDRFIPGFDALCLAEVGTPTPVLEDSIRVRSFERGVYIPTLEKMIEMFGGSRLGR